jgi:hypothetical protein
MCSRRTTVQQRPEGRTGIAVINDAIPLHQMIDGRGGRYDADKFNWLGSPGDRNSVTFMRGDSRDVSTD